MTNNSKESGESFCAHCKTNVVPLPKGLCPSCGRFVPGTRKVPVNREKVTQQREKFIAHYQPQTPLLEETCAQLAAVVERLDAVKLGSPEHRRLTLLMQSLGATLEASRLRAPLFDFSRVELETRTAHLETRLEKIIRYLLEKERNDTANEQREPAADAAPPASASESSSEQMALEFSSPAQTDQPIPGGPDRDEGVSPGRTGKAVPRSNPPASPEPEASPKPDSNPEASEAACRWCNRAPCIGAQHPAFYDLHPMERQQRDDEEATAEMRRQMGKPLSW